MLLWKRLCQKKVWIKKAWSNNIKVQKVFSVQRIIGLMKVFVLKHFGVQKKFLVKKSFCSKKNLGPKNYSSKIFYIRKFKKKFFVS